MKKITIHRTRIGKDIVADFAIPPSQKHMREGKVVILCQGAPSLPGKNALVDFLARKGFYVILPRYRGSWESSGTFLMHEPTKDVHEVMQSLTKPFVSLFEEDKKYVFPKRAKIYIFASSFGGPAGFLLSKDARVKKVVTFSPVCDWRAPSKAEPLDTSHAFVKKAFGEGYRIAKGGYARLAKGNFYNPMTSLGKIDGEKCLVFHARNDEVVPFNSVFDFAYATGATLKASSKGGHMGLSELMDSDTWREVTRFLNR